jgi:putative membrane protein
MMATTMMAGFGWLGMGLMWLWMLVPLALVIGVVWLLARTVGGPQGRRGGDDSAAILRRRLAAGEIDTEQYEQARAALGLAAGPESGADA